MDKEKDDRSDEFLFEGINGGGTLEMVNNAIRVIVANIDDMNTTLDAREINVKMVFKPSDDRTLINIGTKVTPKIAGQEPLFCTADVKIGKNGRAYAKERVKQQPFPFSNVTEIKKVGDKE